jgi:hypothetical protein
VIVRLELLNSHLNRSNESLLAISRHFGMHPIEFTTGKRTKQEEWFENIVCLTLLLPYFEIVSYSPERFELFVGELTMDTIVVHI